MNAMEPSTRYWRRSGYSGGNGDCVEVTTLPGAIAGRDSKAPNAGMTVVDRPRWAEFLAASPSSLE
ncbi:protein of unknown function [Actinopolyspora mzabensis]|uniref:DUF397 domain-containing protein n=1 Tax=Actinopolyspora mzabensis TaxID=995066 RepID=A0A1G8ZQD1_ACTMZ|nr:DUF397 domain-containing protein [Actinopolyspora mzabensis]SDK17233.1 protein of unknown function [Actinopolyspora mzabensis]